MARGQVPRHTHATRMRWHDRWGQDSARTKRGGGSAPFLKKPQGFKKARGTPHHRVLRGQLAADIDKRRGLLYYRKIVRVRHYRGPSIRVGKSFSVLEPVRSVFSFGISFLFFFCNFTGNVCEREFRICKCE